MQWRLGDALWACVTEMNLVRPQRVEQMIGDRGGCVARVAGNAWQLLGWNVSGEDRWGRVLHSGDRGQRAGDVLRWGSLPKEMTVRRLAFSTCVVTKIILQLRVWVRGCVPRARGREGGSNCRRLGR